MESQKNGAWRGSSARRVGPTNHKPRVNGAHINGSALPEQAFAGRVASWWLKHGIRPVPIYRQSKKPKGGKGWNKFRADAETVEQFFASGDNVGGLWGAPSKWVVDVDLDTEESQLCARVLLPETFIYGRKSAPGSHYLFSCENAETKKWQMLDLGTFVEIRSTGTQSVLPPSIHPSKEPYEIYHEAEFHQISKSRLEHLCTSVASAGVLAYHWPEEGARHDFLLTVAGCLLWCGWQHGDVINFCEAILLAVDSKGEAKAKHRRTVKNACKNFAEGHRIPGWPTLSQWIVGDNLRILKNWLKAPQPGGHPGTKGPLSLPSDQLEEEREQESREFEEELKKIPGLVGEISNWVTRWSYTPQPLFSLASALSLVALASRNLYLVDLWDTPLQPYFMLVAPTAGGKEAAKASIAYAAQKINMHKHIFEGFQSYHAMLDTLATPPHMGLWLLDEAAQALRTANRSGGQDEQIMTMILRLYGKGGSYLPGTPGRKHNIEPISFPFFCVFAMSQPDPLIDALTDSHMQIGLLNRFILLDAGERPVPHNHERMNLFPASIERALGVFETIVRPKGDRPFIGVTFQKALVLNKFHAFLEDCSRRVSENPSAQIWGRANQNALICAGLLAIGVDPNRPQITEEIADWAIRLISWSSMRWQTRVDQGSSRSYVERHSKYVESMILRAKQLVGRYKTNYERTLLARGLMPRSALTRFSRHIRGKELDEILAGLITSDLVATGEVEGRECYWIKQVEG